MSDKPACTYLCKREKWCKDKVGNDGPVIEIEVTECDDCQWLQEFDTTCRLTGKQAPDYCPGPGKFRLVKLEEKQ